MASGLYNRGRLFDPKHPDTQVDPGRLAFGQERLAVTPLQMAMVAAAIGNHGAEMRPQIVERIVSPGGKTITHLQPDQLGRPIKRQTADELDPHDGARRDRRHRDGRRNSRDSRRRQDRNRGNRARQRPHDLVRRFRPGHAPRVAIAVVVENQLNGFGGTISAPIAKQVMEALLR